MKTLGALLLLLALISLPCNAGAPPAIMLTRDVPFAAGEWGNAFTLKQGTTWNYIGTDGYYYIVQGNGGWRLPVPGDSASEMRVRYGDRRVEARYQEIATALRENEIVPTRARVDGILNRELEAAAALKELRTLNWQLDRLNREIESLRTTIRNRPVPRPVNPNAYR